HGGQGHPSALQYAQIGIVLAIITAVEVALYYLDLSRNALVGLLLALSALKFALVVLWFMHLRFDNRLFSTLFVGGIVLAIGIFTVALSTVGGKLV
ncbi:MAG: cytochrome C oxidase subunit IV family protein, partial [Chloroflexi bacterium]|nr:cytochrome C oxidase subunit IV family protein [Chloroflexota bacterium]